MTARGSLWGLALTLFLPALGAGQEPAHRLNTLADVARRALHEHDVSRLVGQSTGVQMTLPGSGPSVALGQAQAVATLRAFLRQSDEVDVVVGNARPVGARRGYVELFRRFRVRGTQEVQAQRVLLGYQDLGEGWMLSEVRVLPTSLPR